MLFYAFIGSGPQFVTFCEVARRLKVRPRWDRQSQTRRRGCHCWELQDELFAFCGRTGSACMDLLNRVFSTHLIGFLLRATEQERKSALKRLRYYVSQDAQGIVCCKWAEIQCSECRPGATGGHSGAVPPQMIQTRKTNKFCECWFSICLIVTPAHNKPTRCTKSWPHCYKIFNLFVYDQTRSP